MKKIKLKFVGLWEDFDQKDNAFMRALEKRYDVELCDDPEYIICSVFGLGFYEYVNYDCVRIFYSGENYSPDFTLVDYAMGFDEMSCGDRFLRYPVYLLRHTAETAQDKHIGIGKAVLDEKTRFCNYIYGDKQAQSERAELFHRLCGYKRVDSAGTHLNNMDGFTVDYRTDKLDFQKSCKFTVAAESCSLRGFTTEKIVDAFAAKTVPIYYGDPDIANYFNEKAFVDVRALGGIENAVRRVEELDKNDDLYLSMLSEPAFREPHSPASRERALEEFLYNIFDRPQKEAFRRDSLAGGQAAVHEGYIKRMAAFLPSKLNRDLTVLNSYADKYLRGKSKKKRGANATEMK